MFLQFSMWSWQLVPRQTGSPVSSKSQEFSPAWSPSPRPALSGTSTLATTWTSRRSKSLPTSSPSSRQHSSLRHTLCSGQRQYALSLLSSKSTPSSRLLFSSWSQSAQTSASARVSLQLLPASFGFPSHSSRQLFLLHTSSVSGRYSRWPCWRPPWWSCPALSSSAFFLSSTLRRLCALGVSTTLASPLNRPLAAPALTALTSILSSQVRLMHQNRLTIYRMHHIIERFSSGTPCVMVTTVDDYSSVFFLPLFILGLWCLFEGEPFSRIAWSN